jgi:hypothetical protein
MVEEDIACDSTEHAKPVQATGFARILLHFFSFTALSACD